MDPDHGLFPAFIERPLARDCSGIPRGGGIIWLAEHDDYPADHDDGSNGDSDPAAGDVLPALDGADHDPGAWCSLCGRDLVDGACAPCEAIFDDGSDGDAARPLDRALGWDEPDDG
jgi:hypothetical protein